MNREFARIELLAAMNKQSKASAGMLEVYYEGQLDQSPSGQLIYAAYDELVNQFPLKTLIQVF